MNALWLAAGLITLGAAIVTLHDIFLVLFAGAVFAIPLRGATVILASRLRLPTAVALIVAIGSIAGTATGVLWAWELLLAGQTTQLLATLPAATEAVARTVRSEPWASRIATIIPDPSVLLTGAGGLIGGVRGVVGGTLAALLDVTIVVFAAVCFAAEPHTYLNGILRLVPPQHRSLVGATLREAADTIGLWLWARLISMVTVGTLAGVGLALLGIPYAAALGLVAAIFSFVPNVGAIAAALPSLVLAAPLGWERVVAIVVLYWLAHSIDDFLVIPIAQSRIVHLPPVLTIAAQLILGLAAGVIGIMMAAPFVAVTIVIVKRILVEGIIERSPREPPRSVPEEPVNTSMH
jgi:predicted PurR-regulated permease PerM